MLFRRTDGKDQPGVAGEVDPDLVRREPLEQKRMAVSRTRISHWEPAVAVEAVLLAVWSREPSFWIALAGAVVGIAVVVLALRTRRTGATAAALLALAAGLAAFAVSRQVRAVERHWPEVREALIQRASRELDRELGAAAFAARRAADSAAAAVLQPRPEAFRQLEAALTAESPEQGAVVVDEEGRPWIWGGRHRVRLEANDRELSAHITPFYVVLEARRQVGPYTALGHVVLAADSAVPDRDRMVASQFAAETGFALEFYVPAEAPSTSDVFDYCLPSCEPLGGVAAPDTLFAVRAVPPSQGSRKLEILRDGERWVAILTTLTLLGLVAFGGSVGRWGGMLGLPGLLVLTPVGDHLALGPLFSSATYYLGVLGPLTASAGALMLVSAVAAVALLQLRRRASLPRIPAVVPALVAAAAPWLILQLSRGISPPATGTSMGMWVGWQVALTLAGAAVLLSAMVLFGRREHGPPWALWVLTGWMVLLAVVGFLAWKPGSPWPLWYGLLWLPPIWCAAWPAGPVRSLLGIAIVAGVGAGLLTWSGVVHGRLILAERDGGRLDGGDPVAIGFLERFGAELLDEPPPRSAAQLYSRWRRSPLSVDDYPGVLTTWDPDDEPIAGLRLAQLDVPADTLRASADSARVLGEPAVRVIRSELGVHYLLGVPFTDSSAVTVGVAPRSQLIPPVLVARFLRGERRIFAPYSMYLGDAVTGDAAGGRFAWRRDGWTVRASYPVTLAHEVRNLHAVVALRGLSQLLVRGALLVFLDLLVLLLVVCAGRLVAGMRPWPAGFPEGFRLRSYRNRLALALAAFFVVPTLGFAAWSAGRLRVEAIRGRDLVIRQTLRDAVGSARDLSGLATGDVGPRLAELADRLGTDLLWYEDGELVSASAAVLAELGMLEPYLPPDVFRALTDEDAVEITGDAVIGGQLTRVGYRSLGTSDFTARVLAAPRLVELTDIQRDQEDLAFSLVLVTLLGLGGAVGLAAFASSSLARPVQSLESAAGAVGRGAPLPPFDQDVPTEFVSVVNAFERMAHDVEASQQALEASRRRTATVLANVATGVVALDAAMHVSIANAAAQALLESSLTPGADVQALTAEDWGEVWGWVGRFLRRREALEQREEFTVGRRRIRVQVAALQADPRGCVVALDDMTEVTQAIRVLAWGEVARQVAHEIKNPLTPIRLGVQHLQRARRRGSPDFDATLERTAQQILAEIERLDAIARAFARFGAPPTEAGPLVLADMVTLAADAAALYGLAGETEVTVRADGPVMARVRKDEVKEVLINLVENARHAGATTVQLHVRSANSAAVLDVVDDGRGIAADDLPRVFEPHFSTTTSGTGLGLAICRRLVESWGGRIAVTSAPGRGTTFTIAVPDSGPSV